MGKMRSYELVLVLEPKVTESDKKKLLESVEKWLGEAKIEILEWGKKTLVRPIKKVSEGFFLLLKVKTEQVIPSDLEKKLLMEERVLRHLLVRK